MLDPRVSEENICWTIENVDELRELIDKLDRINKEAPIPAIAPLSPIT